MGVIGICLGISISSQAAIVTPEVEEDFQKRLPVIEKAGNLRLSERELTEEQRDALKMLYAYMPLPDMTDRDVDYYLDMVVDPALKARDEMPWGASVDDALFRHFVLPVRVNNEALDCHRPEFYAQLRDRVKDLPMKDAILEVNHWCHEKATYQPSDARTHSPLQTVGSAIGRCGEESTFTVAALRSVGIPARQVYTPRWAHTDDNHAWVEAWADGEWYFLGACEPEPVLNLGWFNAPASRGMLMHARVFGNYKGEEERLEKIDGITFINVTRNYAPVDTLTVRAVYPPETQSSPQGVPAADADVSFRLYNYAEFYPIAEKKTDTNGEASLVAGLGDLLVWVTDGERIGFGKASVGKDRTLTVVLDNTPGLQFSCDLDVTPPEGRDNSVEVSDEQRENNDMRIKAEDALRNEYLATFATDAEISSLATALGLESDALHEIMKNARGNHAVIATFLRGLRKEERRKGLLLLQSLTEKDLTDVSPEILEDHIGAVDPGAGELFGRYVMSPRIDNEELTTFRHFFATMIPASDMESFRDDPGEWTRWVAENIKAGERWYPEQITMSPEAVWKSRSTSPESRNLFYVAGARAMGIPARIDAVTGKTQWADKTGNWVDAAFDSADIKDAPERQGGLKMEYSATPIIPDPKYYSHFTVSKIEDGKPRLLNYPDFIELSETFGKGERLDTGTYLVTTGQRMADGGVLAHIETVRIGSEETSIPLKVRQDESRVQVIGSFDSESRYLPEGEAAERSLLSTTGRGYYVLVLVKGGHEPGNHALRDIAEASAELEACGRPIVVLSEGTGVNLSDFPTLPSVVSIGEDVDGRILGAIAEGMNLETTELPVIMIADTFNRVVFISQGYTIGAGSTIASVLNRLQ